MSAREGNDAQRETATRIVAPASGLTGSRPRSLPAETKFVLTLAFALAWAFVILYTLTRVALAQPGDRAMTVVSALLCVALTVIAARTFARWLASFDTTDES